MKKNRLLILISAIALPFAIGCSANGSSGETGSMGSVDVTVVDSGRYFDSGSLAGSLNPKRIEVFLNRESLYYARANYAASIADVSVDFTTHQAALLTMGTKGSGGYAITVQRVEEFDDHIKLKVLSTGPGAGCIVTTELTHPYQLVEIGSRKNLIVEEQYVLEPCEG